MEHQRKELAPTLLIALAAMSLGVSCAIGIGLNWPAPAKRLAKQDRIDPPRRASEPLVWQTSELPALIASPPIVETPAPQLSLLFEDPINEYALIPYKLRPLAEFEDRLVVMLPEAPRWQAGDRAAMVVTARMRRAWSLGSVDTFALAKASGRLWNAASLSGVDRFRMLARAGVSSLLTSTPRASAPRLISARPVTPIMSPSIADYIANSPRGGDFPVPTALAEQLDRVAETPEHAAWAWAAAYRLRTLMAASADEAGAHRAIGALSQAAAEAGGLADQSNDAGEATELRRAAYAVTRRVATWRAEQTQTLVMRLNPADQLAGARWAMAMPLYGPRPGSMLARKTAVERAPQGLRVARRLEAYERQPSSRLAMLLAEDAARLATVEDAEGQSLAAAINQNYRNANLRVAIASDLIERMLPEPEPIVSVIRDRIAGTPVTGRSTTETEIAVLLAPDEAAWRIGLQAKGVVTSRTQSRGGPAVLNSKGATSFAAKKLVLVTPAGLRAAPTVANAQTMSQRLVGLSTDYDRVPLLGNYVRSAARSEYGRLRTRAKSETRHKVERQVSLALDQRVDSQLGQMEQRFTQNVVDRASSLGLEIKPIEMRTTDKRLISRLRIAGDNQLGAHTPRMRAPSDSLLSFQMHESTLNNALDGLGLAGQTLNSEELRQRLVERLGLPAQPITPGEQATFRFAKEEPVRLTFSEGRAKLTLKLDEISVRHRRHRNFRVHAYYKPAVEGLTAMLVQDGTPHIEGRLRTGARIHLHGVMGKVLGENARVPLVRLNDQTPERFAAALEGLATNQFVIEDGWLGLAIGPPRGPGSVAARVGTYVR